MPKGGRCARSPYLRTVEDNYRHQGLRHKLVEQLRQKGIRDHAVLEAVHSVPRHWFMDKAFVDHAYEDNAFPIDKDQTISQPYTVARMTELLEVRKHMKVLEIGTGSGYQAAILARMGARVFTVERIKALYDKARELLSRIGFPQVKCFYRDGMKGLPAYAPYDRIIVTAGADAVPTTLLDQLAVGGMLVIPVGMETQEMTRFTRREDGSFAKETFGDYRFVPFLGGLDETP